MTNAKRYVVLWDEGEVPEIVPAAEGEGKSWTEAKREVLGFYVDLRDTAREMITLFRAMKAEDVDAPEALASEVAEAADAPSEAATDAPVDGAGLIAEARRAQIVEGHTAERDALEHPSGELAAAAVSYAMPPPEVPMRQVFAPSDQVYVPYWWPWPAERWKPVDRVADLVQAGALIAAEIDRLLAERGESDG